MFGSWGGGLTGLNWRLHVWTEEITGIHPAMKCTTKAMPDNSLSTLAPLKPTVIHFSVCVCGWRLCFQPCHLVFWFVYWLVSKITQKQLCGRTGPGKNLVFYASVSPKTHGSRWNSIAFKGTVGPWQRNVFYSHWNSSFTHSTYCTCEPVFIKDAWLWARQASLPASHPHTRHPS